MAVDLIGGHFLFGPYFGPYVSGGRKGPRGAASDRNTRKFALIPNSPHVIYTFRQVRPSVVLGRSLTRTCVFACVSQTRLPWSVAPSSTCPFFDRSPGYQPVGRYPSEKEHASAHRSLNPRVRSTRK